MKSKNAFKKRNYISISLILLFALTKENLIFGSRKITLFNLTEKRIRYYSKSNDVFIEDGLLSPYQEVEVVVTNDLFLWPISHPKNIIALNEANDIPTPEGNTNYDIDQPFVLLFDTLGYNILPLKTESNDPLKKTVFRNCTNEKLYYKKIIDKEESKLEHHLQGTIESNEYMPLTLFNKCEIWNNKSENYKLSIKNEIFPINCMINIFVTLNFQMVINRHYANALKEEYKEKHLTEKDDLETAKKDENEHEYKKVILKNESNIPIIYKEKNSEICYRINIKGFNCINLNSNLEIWTETDSFKKFHINLKSLPSWSRVKIKNIMDVRILPTSSTKLFNMNLRNKTDEKLYYSMRTFNDQKAQICELAPNEKVRVSIFAIIDLFQNGKSTWINTAKLPRNCFIDVIDNVHFDISPI